MRINSNYIIQTFCAITIHPKKKNVVAILNIALVIYNEPGRSNWKSPADIYDEIILNWIQSSCSLPKKYHSNGKKKNWISFLYKAYLYLIDWVAVVIENEQKRARAREREETFTNDGIYMRLYVNRTELYNIAFECFPLATWNSNFILVLPLFFLPFSCSTVSLKPLWLLLLCFVATSKAVLFRFFFFRFSVFQHFSFWKTNLPRDSMQRATRVCMCVCLYVFFLLFVHRILKQFNNFIFKKEQM